MQKGSQTEMKTLNEIHAARERAFMRWAAMSFRQAICPGCSFTLTSRGKLGVGAIERAKLHRDEALAWEAEAANEKKLHKVVALPTSTRYDGPQDESRLRQTKANSP